VPLYLTKDCFMSCTSETCRSLQLACYLQFVNMGCCTDRAAAPPPFRTGSPALCGSCPLVTPYYCRLGDLLCFVFMSVYCMFDLSVYYLFLQYFDTVGWVLTCENRLPYNLYCVGGDVKHCSIQSIL